MVEDFHTGAQRRYISRVVWDSEESCAQRIDRFSALAERMK